ncbi:MAG: transcriptional regulator [Paludibacter sp.]|nr:transcriptional regulator [Paludibacter sp.]
MNYILQLSGFFQRVAVDNRLNPTHISLYMAIFQFWNAERFQNPVSISRQELMRISKISAKATYHKCIKDLHNFGYIQYLPSFNPFKGSLVYLFDMQSSAKLVTTHDRTNIETSIEQALVPYINKENILNLNIEKEDTQPKNDIVLKVSKKRVKVVEFNGQKVEPENKASKSKLEAIFAPPDIVAVRNYFVEQKSVEIEAEKFYNYFQSNGWKVGGKAPMKDWQAAASNWILNIPQFSHQPKFSVQNQPIPGNLNVTTGKNYSEPL